MPFIVFEGIDGSGKTACSLLLTDRLRQQQISTAWTCEPSDRLIGSLIRNILRDGKFDKVDRSNRTMALLFSVDRSDHLAQFVEPALQRGKVVICDRYVLSTSVYQEYEYTVADWREPDITFLLDVDIDKAIIRILERGACLEVYETKERLQKARQKYIELALGLNALALYSDRRTKPIVVVDTTDKSISEVVEFCFSYLVQHKVVQGVAQLTSNEGV